MVAVIADRVRDVSVTTGLGVFILSGAPNMLYKTFANVCVVGDTFPYVIQHRSADEWEVGIGTYTAANELTRTRIISSSTGTAPVTFTAGEKDVILGSGAYTEAMRFNVPISPVSNPTVSSPGYSLDGVIFADKFGTAIRLRDASGTARITINPTVVDLTVPVALPADPAQALHAATKQYVDGRFVPSSTNPVMDGVAAPGVATTYARGDHVHPSDTTKAAVAHTHTASQVTDFSEAVDDRVSSFLSAGSNITLTYNDAANVLTIAAAGAEGPPPSTAASTSFVPTAGISSSNVQTAIEELDAEKVAVADFPEAVDDRVAALLQAGTNVTLNYNDAANTLTINSSGGGGTGNVTLTCSDTPPPSPAVNDLWWKTNSGGLYVFYDDGSSTQWVQTGTISSDGGGGGNIIASDTPPPSPTDNTVWWKSDTGATYIWFNDGSSSQWVQTGDGSGGGGSARITSGDTPPAFPLPDDLWWKSNSGVMFIYFDDGTSSQWVETGAASSRVFIGDTAPVAPVDGMMWWKSNTGVTYLWYNDGSSSQWVAMCGAP